jgi:hypothetical protein
MSMTPGSTGVVDDSAADAAIRTASTKGRTGALDSSATARIPTILSLSLALRATAQEEYDEE